MSEHLVRGIEAFSQKDYKGAILHLEAAPPEEFLEVTYYLALCYARVGEPDRALECIEVLLLADSNVLRQVQIRILKALLLVEQGRHDQARSWLAQLLAEGIESAILYNLYGVQLVKAGDLAGGLEALNKALKLEPNNPGVQNNLAFTLAEMGVYLERALKLARQALMKDPENHEYLDTLGWIYHKMGNHALALKFLEKAYRLGNHPVAREHLRLARGAAAEGVRS